MIRGNAREKFIESIKRALYNDGSLKSPRKICNHCLGRLFGKAGYGLDNWTRGYALRNFVSGPEESNKDCEICNGLFTELDKFADLACEKLRDYDYSTFVIGTKLDPEIIENEEKFWIEVGTEHAEPIKLELNREIGKKVESIVGKEADNKKPDIAVTIDTRYDSVELQIAPLFICGRYLKYSREIPQTKWPCKKCNGRGCNRCNGTGKMYQESVEEIIAKPFMDATKGSAHTFHGMGREDIDARMLGSGRPFVLEITKPVIRKFNLEDTVKKVNEIGKEKVEIRDVRWGERKDIIRVKEERHPKTYRIEVEFEDAVNNEKINELPSIFTGKRISQKTPTRVVHRRADKARLRRVLGFAVETLGGEKESKNASFIIKGESGLYIKELFHGDNGRTQGSVAEALGTSVKVIALDVIAIHDDEVEG
ncbi:MAG: tRNA pseudouridine(54/55) synthase Pus10 [Thermoplasmata archaeon]